MKNHNAARHATRKTLTNANAPSPMLSLVMDAENLALVFLFTNFDRQPDGADGVLTVLPRIYSTARPDSALFAATSAFALATFNPPEQPDRPYIAKACQKYGQAIAKLRSDCQDPDVSTEDQTLLAALMMGLLEVSSFSCDMSVDFLSCYILLFFIMQSHTPISINDNIQIMTSKGNALRHFSAHVKGALSIAELRGEKNFRNDISRELLSFVVMRSVISNVAIPPNLKTRLHHDQQARSCGKDESSAITDFVTHMTRLGLLTTDLRKDADASLMLPKRQCNKRAVFDLLERCHHLDVAFIEWHDSVPASWQCDLACTSVEESHGAPESWLFWPGEIHQYENIYLARNWNSYRSHRIVIQAVAIRCLEWLADYSAVNPNITNPLGPMVNQPVVSKARNKMQTLVDSICASIPFLMGDLPYLTKILPRLPAEDEKGPAERDKAKKTISTDSDQESSSSSIEVTVREASRIGPFFSLHSLLVSIAVPDISTTQRRWITGRIQEVARLVKLNPEMIKARLKENVLGFSKIPMDDFT